MWATDVRADGLAHSRAQHTAILDVRDVSAVASVFDAVDAAGGADAVVNNAGIFPLREWDEHDPELMHLVYDVNVVGGVALCAGWRPLDDRPGGRWLNHQRCITRLL